jgi:hypothetical protein
MKWRSIQVNTQENVLGTGDPNSQNSFRFAQETQTDIFIPQAGLENYEYLALIIRMSDFSEEYDRYFDTIGTVLAVIGAYWGSLFTAVGIVAYKLNEASYHWSLAKGVYRVQQKKHKSRKAVIVQKQKTTNSQDTNTDDNIHQKHTFVMIKNTIENFKDTYCKVKYGVCELLSYIICLSCFQKRDIHQQRKQEFFHKINKKTEEDCDILTILRRMKEIELLKEVLLSPPQLIIFDYIKRQPITLSDDSEEIPLKNKYDSEKSLNFELQEISLKPPENGTTDEELLFHSYVNIQNMNEKDLVNKNLMEKMDPELRHILESIALTRYKTQKSEGDVIKKDLTLQTDIDYDNSQLVGLKDDQNVDLEKSHEFKINSTSLLFTSPLDMPLDLKLPNYFPKQKEANF